VIADATIAIVVVVVVVVVIESVDKDP